MVRRQCRSTVAEVKFKSATRVKEVPSPVTMPFATSSQSSQSSQSHLNLPPPPPPSATALNVAGLEDENANYLKQYPPKDSGEDSIVGGVGNSDCIGGDGDVELPTTALQNDSVSPPAPPLPVTPAWTAQEEIILFHSMLRHKPVGFDRHLRMIFIHKRFQSRWRTREPKLRVPERVTAEMLWQKLESMYDLSALNFENQMPAALMEEKEFELPSTEFGAVMDEYSLRRLSLGDDKEGGGRQVGIGNADRKRNVDMKPASKRGRKSATTHNEDSSSPRSASALSSNSLLTSMSLAPTATASTQNASSTSKLTSDSLKSSSMAPSVSSSTSSIRSTTTFPPLASASLPKIILNRLSKEEVDRKGRKKVLKK